MSYPPSPPAANPAAYNYTTTSKGNVKAYDDRLASDGAALCGFLHTHVATPPKVFMHCKGVHYNEYTDGDGRSIKEEIPDFKFTIDLSSLLVAETNPPPIFVVGDEEPAYRGRMSLDVAVPRSGQLEEGSTRVYRNRANKEELRKAETRKARLWSLGLPPWTAFAGETLGMQAGIENEAVYRTLWGKASLPPPRGLWYTRLRPSTRPLRDIADEFCASWKPLKEFRLRKSVYGWKIPTVETKVKEIVWSNKLAGCEHVDVQVQFQGLDIVVRPNGFFWALYTNGWVLFLLMITFIYPIFFWPLKVFLLGGTWLMTGCAYTFVAFEGGHTEDTSQAEGAELPTAGGGASPQVGNLEDAWLKAWEKALVGLVLSRHVGAHAITDPSRYAPPVGRGYFRYQ